MIDDIIKKYDQNNDGKIDLNEYLFTSKDQAYQIKIDKETSQFIKTRKKS